MKGDTTPPRYVALAKQFVQTALVQALAYRVEFIVSTLIALFWAVFTLAPLYIVFSHRTEIGGWTFEQSLVVLAFFVMQKALLEGFVAPNLMQIVDHVRQGTLDYVLLRPADAQFLLSFSRFAFPKLIDFTGGVLLFGYALYATGHVPTVTQALACLALLLAGTVILYAIFTLVVSTAFWLVRVDNLAFVLDAIFDAGQFPVTVFRGTARVVLTFVIPVGLMTTYPAMALLGTLSAQGMLVAFAIALVFFALARAVFMLAISKYASASS
jgi:ABC-2 type transport system permease protein